MYSKDTLNPKPKNVHEQIPTELQKKNTQIYIFLKSENYTKITETSESSPKQTQATKTVRRRTNERNHIDVRSIDRSFVSRERTQKKGSQADDKKKKIDI